MIQVGTDRRSWKPDVPFADKSQKTKVNRFDSEFSAFLKKRTVKNSEEGGSQEKLAIREKEEPELTEEIEMKDKEIGTDGSPIYMPWLALQEAIIKRASAPVSDTEFPATMVTSAVEQLMEMENNPLVQQMEIKQEKQQVIVSPDSGERGSPGILEKEVPMVSEHSEEGKIDVLGKAILEDKPVAGAKVLMKSEEESVEPIYAEKNEMSFWQDSLQNRPEDDYYPENGMVQSELRAHGNVTYAAISKNSFSKNHPENTIQIHTTRQALGKDMAEVLISRMPLKEGVLELELEPTSLGKLTIRVAYESGRSAVTVMSSNVETLEILSRNAVQIAHILEERTGQQVVVYTPQASESGDESAFEQQRHHQQQNQKERRNEPEESFAQQLRLGLI